MKIPKAIVLAAGKGTRMSAAGRDIPKVLNTVLGKPVLSCVLDALPVESPSDVIIVVGYKREMIMESFPGYTFAVQEEQLGTGHAVMCAENALSGYDGNVLVCLGDMPLITRDTFTKLYEFHLSMSYDCTLLSCLSDAPMAGYGRVLRRKDGSFAVIAEEKDFDNYRTLYDTDILEYNSGVMVFDASALFKALKKLRSDNAQHEYYLTDAPSIIAADGGNVGVFARDMGDEIIGVNTPEQLSEAEKALSGRAR